MIEIENGIPLPPKTRGRKKSKYPIADLEVKQSFFVACTSEDNRKRIISMSSLCNRHTRKTGRQYTCRVVDGGVRVWRVK